MYVFEMERSGLGSLSSASLSLWLWPLWLFARFELWWPWNGNSKPWGTNGNPVLLMTEILAMWQCLNFALHDWCLLVFFICFCPEQTVSSPFHCWRTYFDRGIKIWPILPVYFIRRLCQTFLWFFFLQRISSHFWWEKQHQLRLWQVALLGSFSTAMDAIDLFGTRTGPACNA